MHRGCGMDPVGARVQAVIRRVLTLRGVLIDPFTLMEFATMLKGLGCSGDELALESAANVLAPLFEKSGFSDPLGGARSAVEEIVGEVFGKDCGGARQA